MQIDIWLISVLLI